MLMCCLDAPHGRPWRLLQALGRLGTQLTGPADTILTFTSGQAGMVDSTESMGQGEARDRGI